MKNRINSATGRLLSNQRLMLTIPLVLAILLFIVGCGGSGAPTPTNPPPADSTKPDVASESASGVADLPPEQRADYYQAKPAITIDTNRTYQATIQTSKGDIVVSLDAKAAPEHVNNFIFLSNEGFYNGLTFHRVEPGFVIQGGDPLGVGNGGPGYPWLSSYHSWVVTGQCWM
jgi:hypothetical protein